MRLRAPLRLLLALALSASVGAIHARAAAPPPGATANERSPELSRVRVPEILLQPLPSKGGVPRMAPPLGPPPSPERLAEFEARVRALKGAHFGHQPPAARRAGIERLREFTDPAAFGPLWAGLERERDDVRLAVLDHFARQGAQGQEALARVAIASREGAIRAEATRRIERPPHARVLAVLDEGLRSTEHETVNNAGLLAGAVHAIEAIPALIFAQYAQDTVRAQGDLAWIAIGTTRSYVANVIPVTGDNSGAFQPVIGQIREGVVMRVADCVATTYRADVHNSLLAMASFDTGEDLARIGWDMRAWWRWFNDEYVPFKRREDEALARAAAAKTPPAGAPGADENAPRTAR
jgi:hypothetical protein